MKAKTRTFWMKLHAYLACFFLPFTLIYIVTGVLHLFDIHGDVKTTSEYKIEMPSGWTDNEAEAQLFVENFLATTDHSPLPEDYYPDEQVHDWFGRKQEVILVPSDISNQAKLIIKEHDFLLQLLLIHKGFAGKIFWILGVLFGLHLLISVVSGVLLVLQLPRLRSMSILSVLLACLFLGFVFFIG